MIFYAQMRDFISPPFQDSS